MCLQYIKLKTKNDAGLRYAYVPCGKCADCRAKARRDWQFRLNSEFFDLKKKGWNIAFCTLTYEDRYLPKISEDCFKDVSQYREIACFNRKEVKQWIDSIRQYCKYHYNFTKGNNIRYFIASEYGSLTHRPHYHAILAWPSSFSYEDMHALASHFWTSGYLFPRKPEGDGKCMCFEVVGDPTRALGYVSKYACKDIDFIEEIDGIDFTSDKDVDDEKLVDMFKNCQPFHMQSRGLGFEVIKNMSDEDKMEVYRNGMSFVGDGEVYRIPMYIKNKLLYDNYYVMEENVDQETGEVTWKRMVRRKASKFFEENKREIFEQKAKFYQKYVEETTGEWLSLNGVSDEDSKKLGFALEYSRNRLSKVFDVNDFHINNMMGQLYIAYNNIPSSHCYDCDLCEQWMQRYRKPEFNYQHMRGYDLYDSYALSFLKNYWYIVDIANSYVASIKLEDRERQERLTKRILDFYNNCV